MLCSNIKNITPEDLYFSLCKIKVNNKDQDYYNFSNNLFLSLNNLANELNTKTYKHGPYRKFVVDEYKKREISVPKIKDKLVQRYLYDKIIHDVNKKLLPNVFSCRKDYGLHKAVNKLQEYLYGNKNGYILKLDIKKCFDSIDHEILMDLIKRFIKDDNLYFLTEKIVESFCANNKKGLPLGNITSQIFSHVYLNELDRYIVYSLKLKKYVRYGDDIVIICKTKYEAERIKIIITNFVNKNLKLEIQEKSCGIYNIKYGGPFLGLIVHKNGFKLLKKVWSKIKNNVNYKNISSYTAVLEKFSPKSIKEINERLYLLNYANI